MKQVKICPAGLWDSPISAALAAARSACPSEIRLDGEDVYWLESRPSEGGRLVIVRRVLAGEISEVLPPPFSARSRVHEYGGGAYAVAGGVVYFSHAVDGRLYRLDPGRSPRPITPAGDFRYADLVVDPRRERILAVREDHCGAGFPINTLVLVDRSGHRPVETLFSGRDFYAYPRLSPDGSQIAFLAWDLPDMPWEGTELWTADLDDAGRPKNARRVAGGREESIFQPEWSPAGELYFVSDRSGWWNIYRMSDGKIVPVCPLEAEFGLPLWVLGGSTYAFTGDGRIVAAFCRKGLWRLGIISPAVGGVRELDCPYTDLSGLRGREGSVIFVAASFQKLFSVIEYLPDSDRFEVIRNGGEERRAIDPAFLSLPQPIEFPTGKGETAHGLFYPPRHPGFRLPEGALPPLLVVPHGGPTGAASSALSLKTQFWTSRGFAVLLVNYRGSTGYGRGYRRALDGRWGEAEVEDCLQGARWLAEKGMVDPGRMAIRGSSAGGFTALLALARSDLFRAGAVYYGVSDLELLAAEDHKFESGSLSRLVGPYPQRRDLYRERSPVNLAGQISAPVIFFQGEDDRVVPPNQTERMAAALGEKGVPAEVIRFPGEGHGFRSAETVRNALESESAFYRRFLFYKTGNTSSVK